MASVIISNVFDIAHSSYNLRNETKFTPKNSHITKYATATVSNIGPIWHLPNDC